ncbi:MAG: amino acid ABC transporter substrate-binding protein [Polaromonas sp.]|nr:MAG: amino acid ABC transporter substrate-binding protein [Polaromonas sp.]
MQGIAVLPMEPLMKKAKLLSLHTAPGARGLHTGAKVLVQALAMTAWMAASTAWAQSTLEKVKSRSMLVVGYREDAAPFSMADGKTPAGYSIDLCAPIIERIGQASGAKNLRVVFQAVEPERAVNLLKSGAIDLVCANMSDTEARRQLVAFSPPIYYAALRVLVRSGDKLASVDQLAGKSVATIGGTTAPGSLASYAALKGLKWQVTRVLQHEAAMSQLELGQVAGYARDDVLLMRSLQTLKNPADFMLLPERLSAEPIAIAYRQADPTLQKLVDLSVVEAMRNGLLQSSYDKWFVKPVAPSGKALNLPMPAELSALLAAAK